ncbi:MULTISPECIES: hypothetical protein [unclassified Streptomyces]|uniref:hypothetical protein n=1 Tax=unclassified Streptomyces TaxID=2593676 RepID=UPI0022573E78|nr:MULTISPECIES: hypothetical protein [unclassified Streptomyces]MCX4527639.1 hypothetical protein [Streptomyces sp. NBC_01551]MCX4541763.1 hypothetical protein [Streptomyces sp. NBC_01565]
MSFGDPHNPYGQQQGQPGYGYPQQAPQGIPPQPGYGYPQQQAPQAYPGYPSYQPPPMQMPGLMKAARVVLFVIGGFQLIGAILAVVFGALFAGSEDSDVGDVLGGAAIALGVGLALLATLSITLAARLGKGATPVRVLTIIYGALGILGNLGNVASSIAASSSLHEESAGATIAGSLIGSAIGLTISGIILGSMVGSAATAWFQRPRY